jgi:hypothetical protein
MLNKTLLALALGATFGAAALAPNAAFAWTAPAGHRVVFPTHPIVARGPIFHPTPGPIRPPIVFPLPVGHGPVIFPGRPFHHWVYRDGRWIVFEGAVVADVPAPVAAPGPCTCLTKSYTNDGQVLFADICTKESAAAPINGNTAAATPAPQN